MVSRSDGRVLMGHVDVDSGQLMVGDPCYLSSWKGNDWNPGTPKGEYSYGGACEATVTGVAFGELNHDGGHPGAAVAFGGFGGDGTFPVYAEYDSDGYLSKVTIDFGYERDEDYESNR